MQDSFLKGLSFQKGLILLFLIRNQGKSGNTMEVKKWHAWETQVN